MKKSTVSKLLSITLALSMTLGSGSMAVFADDAPATEEIETEVVVEEDADAAEGTAAAEESETLAETSEQPYTEAETVIQAEEEVSTPAESESVEKVTVETTTAVDDTAEIEVIADEETEQGDAALAEAEEFTGYVLMNIPYDKFYEAEGTSDVDAVSSATLNKPRTGGLAGGSYHVNTDGSDITGVIYPVFVSDPAMLAGYNQVTDESSVEITVTNRGKETTTTYAGKDALFEAPSYSYYMLKETPTYFKTLNNDGSFSKVTGDVQTVEGVTGEVTTGGRHTDIEIKLSGTEGIDSGTTVSGVVLTDAEGQKYGMRHVYNIWRGTELGWNLGEYDLNGKTITNIRYYTQDAVIDYPVELKIGDSGYVLMNIPYDKFYEAEGTSDVDAVSSATLNKPRTGGLAGGSYHVNADGTDITGIIYPVFVSDLSVLSEQKQITDESSVDITVTNRGQTTTTTYAGKEALFEAPSYAYYMLSDKPARSKKLTVNEDGSFTFGAVSGRAATVQGVTGEVTTGGRHTNIEIKLSGTEGIDSGTTVSGVVLTDAEGQKYGMRHVYNIWRGTELGWNTDENAPMGKTITNIRYYTQDAIVDFPVEIIIKSKVEIDTEIAESVKGKIDTANGSFETAADAQKAVDAANRAFNNLTNDQKAQLAIIMPDAEDQLASAQKAADEQKAKEDQAGSNPGGNTDITPGGNTGTNPGENTGSKVNNTTNTTQTVTKQSQSLKKLTPATKKLKASKLKKKKQTFKLKAKINGQGKVTFKKVSGNKKIKISKAGKVTVKKGLKKGTYKVKVKVSIAATGNYTAAEATKTIKIKVK